MKDHPHSQAWSLKGKTALVCGASRGIGAATAQLMAQRGASVILAARNHDALQQLQSQLPQFDATQRHQSLSLDLSQSEKLTTRLAELPTVHILINNSGGPAPGPLLEADPEAFIAGLRPHVVAAQTLVQALLPGMRHDAYGRIINVISTSVKQPIAGLGVSNTIRGAMANWAKTLAAELGPLGITINNVLPGFTATERLDSIIQNRAQKQGKSPEQVASEMRAQVPLGRFAEARETAEAICFLASPAAAYITGINLPVDGGRTQSL